MKKLNTIAILNQRKGVGKTTTTLSMGMKLAEQGYRVLLADLDPRFLSVEDQHPGRGKGFRVGRGLDALDQGVQPVAVDVDVEAGAQGVAEERLPKDRRTGRGAGRGCHDASRGIVGSRREPTLSTAYSPRIPSGKSPLE